MSTYTTDPAHVMDDDDLAVLHATRRAVEAQNEWNAAQRQANVRAIQRAQAVAALAEVAGQGGAARLLGIKQPTVADLVKRARQVAELAARTWFLSYETPGDGENAWVIRSEQDEEIGNPEWVTDEIDGDGDDVAKGWATEYLAGRGVPVEGWERVKGMEWRTWRAQVAP